MEKLKFWEWRLEFGGVVGWIFFVLALVLGDLIGQWAWDHFLKYLLFR